MPNFKLKSPSYPQSEAGIIDVTAQKAMGAPYITMELPDYGNQKIGDRIVGYLINSHGEIISSHPRVVNDTDTNVYEIQFQIQKFTISDVYQGYYTVTKLSGNTSCSEISNIVMAAKIVPVYSDCSPENEIYVRTIFTYSINNQQYLFRQNQCDHLVTVNELNEGGKQGEKTSTGQIWINFYDLIFPFVIDETQYIFCFAKNFINKSESTYKSYWMISKIDKKGYIEITDHGYWDSCYDVGFSYNIGEEKFIYLHSKNKNSENKYPYIIHKILPYGKMLKEPIKESSWEYFYGSTFFFAMGGKEYIYVHTENGLHEHTYYFNEDGTIGKMDYNNTWLYYYYPSFPYSIGKDYYYAGQRSADNYCFISNIYPGGNAEQKNEYLEQWDTFYQYQIPFSIDGHQYFLRQDQSKNNWHITELFSDLTMSDTDSANNQ
ncbi:hypothetical protein [Xenorhabdus bharatensis]|uniref:hypothetical protein n=1 Tax=Xenorhabdus bharatensis TaxID=3136256 RepID=UPI0030F439FE